MVGWQRMRMNSQLQTPPNNSNNFTASLKAVLKIPFTIVDHMAAIRPAAVEDVLSLACTLTNLRLAF